MALTTPTPVKAKILNQFGEEFNLPQMFLNVSHPIGSTYTQYPGQDDPNDLFNQNGAVSSWTVVKYGGAFFRTEGGNAKDFLEPMPVTTSDGLEFTVDWASIPQDDRNLFVLSKNFNIGDFVAVDGEFREIKEVKDAGGTWITTAKGETDAWSGIYGFKVDAAFTAPTAGYQNITNVIILQKPTLPNISGAWSNASSWADARGCIITTGSSWVNKESWTDSSGGASYEISASRSSAIYKNNWNEVTPINSTFKVWKRIN